MLGALGPYQKIRIEDGRRMTETRSDTAPYLRGLEIRNPIRHNDPRPDQKAPARVRWVGRDGSERPGRQPVLSEGESREVKL